MRTGVNDNNVIKPLGHWPSASLLRAAKVISLNDVIPATLLETGVMTADDYTVLLKQKNRKIFKFAAYRIMAKPIDEIQVQIKKINTLFQNMLSKG